MFLFTFFSLYIILIIPAADKYNLEVSDTLDSSLCLYKVFLLLVDGPSVLRSLLGLPKHPGKTLLLFPNIPSPLRPNSICGWDPLRGRSLSTPGWGWRPLVTSSVLHLSSFRSREISEPVFTSTSVSSSGFLMLRNILIPSAQFCRSRSVFKARASFTWWYFLLLLQFLLAR